MIALFLSPANTPFAVSIGLMVMIALVEVVGALMGMSPSSALDNLLPEVDTDLDLDADVDIDGVAGGPFDADAPTIPDAPNVGPLSQVLGWLCVGKVPILVLLIVFLTTFGLAGFFLQALVRGFFGAPLPAIMAVVPALFAAVPATRMAGLTLARIIPKEQTEAVSSRQFIGKVATIIRGEARKHAPAEAKLTDRFGQTHYMLVEPDAEADTFGQGAQVIIVSQSGSIYQAILNTSDAMIKPSPGGQSNEVR